MLYKIYGCVEDFIDNKLVFAVGDYTFLINVVDTNQYERYLNYEVFVDFSFVDNELVCCCFLQKEELDMFRLLKSVDGIGNKVALKILKNIDISDLKTCIKLNLLEELKKIKGIGNKAEKIIYELKPKLTSKEDSIKEREIVETLVKYGLNKEKVIKIIKNINLNYSHEEIIKDVLKQYGNECC